MLDLNFFLLFLYFNGLMIIFLLEGGMCLYQPLYSFLCPLFYLFSSRSDQSESVMLFPISYSLLLLVDVLLCLVSNDDWCRAMAPVIGRRLVSHFPHPMVVGEFSQCLHDKKKPHYMPSCYSISRDFCHYWRMGGGDWNAA
jgi:hypothetical protein